MNRNLRIRHIVRAARADGATPAEVRDVLDVLDTFAPDLDVYATLAVQHGQSAAALGLLNRVTFELSDDADVIEDLRELGPPVAIAPAKEPEWHAIVAAGDVVDPRGRYDELRRR